MFRMKQLLKVSDEQMVIAFQNCFLEVDDPQTVVQQIQENFANASEILDEETASIPPETFDQLASIPPETIRNSTEEKTETTASSTVTSTQASTTAKETTTTTTESSTETTSTMSTKTETTAEPSNGLETHTILLITLGAVFTAAFIVSAVYHFWVGSKNLAFIFTWIALLIRKC